MWYKEFSIFIDPRSSTNEEIPFHPLLGADIPYRFQGVLREGGPTSGSVLDKIKAFCMFYLPKKPRKWPIFRYSNTSPRTFAYICCRAHHFVKLVRESTLKDPLFFSSSHRSPKDKMSVTTTQNQTYYSLAATLRDYDLHHSGGAEDHDVTLSPHPHPHPDPVTARLPNPPDWPTDHRRVPHYRPVNHDLDFNERGVRNTAEGVLISIMLNGCRIVGVSPTDK